MTTAVPPEVTELLETGARVLWPLLADYAAAPDDTGNRVLVDRVESLDDFERFALTIGAVMSLHAIRTGELILPDLPEPKDAAS